MNHVNRNNEIIAKLEKPYLTLYPDQQDRRNIGRFLVISMSTDDVQWVTQREMSWNDVLVVYETRIDLMRDGD